jgi:hypothetical protein
MIFDATWSPCHNVAASFIYDLQLCTFVLTSVPANGTRGGLDKRYRHGRGHSNLVVVARLGAVGAFQRKLRISPDTPPVPTMTTSVPPYSRVASVFSILFRAGCYIFFRIVRPSQLGRSYCVAHPHPRFQDELPPLPCLLSTVSTPLLTG